MHMEEHMWKHFAFTLALSVIHIMPAHAQDWILRRDTSGECRFEQATGAASVPGQLARKPDRKSVCETAKSLKTANQADTSKCTRYHMAMVGNRQVDLVDLQ